ncbi:MAG: hypothetical protein NTX22_10060 [Ignavibacteriales bacterium]|nr:hypothetical protein [Ignavibacteriales bacterium]
MPFKSNRISRTYTQKINATAKEIFPLLCPQKETEWLDGWSYEMIFSLSGFAEEGAVFKTKHAGDVNTIWVVTKYNKKNKIIEFVRLTWETVIVKIRLQVIDNTDGTSDVKVDYTFTTISEKGNEFVQTKSEKQFDDMMRWWEKSMNYYLETGRKLLLLNSKKQKVEKAKPRKFKRIMPKGK